MINEHGKNNKTYKTLSDAASWTAGLHSYLEHNFFIVTWNILLRQIVTQKVTVPTSASVSTRST